MTDAEWQACDDPWQLLAFLCARGDRRKRRLVACACCRRAWHLLTPALRQAVEGLEAALACGTGAEKAADPSWAGEQERASWGLGECREKATSGALYALSDDHFDSAWVCVGDALSDGGGLWIDLRAEVVTTIREVAGNPFRPAAVNPAWLSWSGGTVPRLAAAAYEDRSLPAGTLDRGRLAVLADALEEAGCGDGGILTHLRGDGDHYRGCWLIDSLLGRCPLTGCRDDRIAENSGVVDDDVFVVWASALEAGYLSVADVERWADEQIMAQDRPPGWLLDLSLTSSPETAADLLWSGWRQQVEANGCRSRLHERSGELYLGYLFLRYERATSGWPIS